MKRKDVKVKHELGLGSLARKMLRLLRPDSEFSVSSPSQEESTHITSPFIYHDSLMNLRNDLLEAERAKAEALLESRKHRFL